MNDIQISTAHFLNTNHTSGMQLLTDTQISTVHLKNIDGGSFFFFACEDFGRMCDSSFTMCAFFF